MRTVAKVAAFIVLGLLGSGRAAAGTLRIALLPAVQVDSSTILLADLLPRSAPGEVRNAARDVTLGAAPQFGAERKLARAAVADAIAAGGLAPSWFAIPTTVTVRRVGQEITVEEIFAAIQSWRANNAELADLSGLQPDDLVQDSATPEPPGYAGLEVTQVTFDPFIDRIRFRLLPKASGRVLPFYVTAKMPAEFLDSPAESGEVARANASLALRHSKTAPRDTAPPVAAGRLARLHLHSADMDMLLAVTPLQQGYLDQVIRVRLSGTGTTMRARVVGNGYLDATF